MNLYNGVRSNFVLAGHPLQGRIQASEKGVQVWGFGFADLISFIINIP